MAIINVRTVGAEAEDEKIELLLSQVKGKDIAEVVACGREKMASLPARGVVAAAVGVLTAGGGDASAATAALAAAEAKKEEKKEDVEDSDDVNTSPS